MGTLTQWSPPFVLVLAIAVSIASALADPAFADEPAIAEIPATPAERQREAAALVRVVAGAGFYGLRDPKQKEAFQKLQTMPAEAAPLLAEMLAAGHTNRVRGWIEVYRPLYLLKGMGKEAKVALPDVIKALEDQHAINIGAAAEVLAEIGPEAKEAVPALLAAWEKRTARGTSQFRNAAVGRALKAIDPEAAAKAGVE